MYFQSSSQWVLRFRTYNTHCPAFLPNIKLELLQRTVLKPSRVFGKTIDIGKISYLSSKCIFNTSLRGSMVFSPINNLTGIFLNIKLNQLQITVLRQWQDLSKTIIFLKGNFDCFRLDVFSRLLWMYSMF